MKNYVKQSDDVYCSFYCLCLSMTRISLHKKWSRFCCILSVNWQSKHGMKIYVAVSTETATVLWHELCLTLTCRHHTTFVRYQHTNARHNDRLTETASTYTNTTDHFSYYLCQRTLCNQCCLSVCLYVCLCVQITAKVMSRFHWNS